DGFRESKADDVEGAHTEPNQHGACHLEYERANVAARSEDANCPMLWPPVCRTLLHDAGEQMAGAELADPAPIACRLCKRITASDLQGRRRTSAFFKAGQEL